MNGITYAIFCIGLIVYGVNDAYALRCGYNLVNKGDYVSRMYEYCGSPLHVMRDIGVNGDRVVYIYKMNGRTQVITTRDNLIIDIRSR